MNRLTKAAEIEFPKICDPRGNLSFIEGSRHVPFPIKFSTFTTCQAAKPVERMRTANAQRC